MIINFQTFINEGVMDDHIFLVVKVMPLVYTNDNRLKDLRKKLGVYNIMFKSVSESDYINEIFIGPIESEEQARPIAKIISDFIDISDFKAISLGDDKLLVKYIANRSDDLHF